MTPARKKALQWFYGRGDVTWRELNKGPVSEYMLNKMIVDGHVDSYRKGILYVHHLTDKGRRALNGEE